MDEFSSADSGLADAPREKWSDQRHLIHTGTAGISIINTPAAIVLGMVYNFLPFMVLPVYNVLVKIDDNTINAAKDLGANEFQTFIHVWLPLSLPGIVSGVTMVFVPA